MKWEYSVLFDDYVICPEDAQRLGDEGWELVGVTISDISGRCAGYFKRPKE